MNTLLAMTSLSYIRRRVIWSCASTLKWHHKARQTLNCIGNGVKLVRSWSSWTLWGRLCCATPLWEWIAVYMFCEGIQRSYESTFLSQESADKLFKYEIFIMSRQTSVNLNYLYYTTYLPFSSVMRVVIKITHPPHHPVNNTIWMLTKQDSSVVDKIFFSRHIFDPTLVVRYTFIQGSQLVILAPAHHMCENRCCSTIRFITWTWVGPSDFPNQP